MAFVGGVDSHGQAVTVCTHEWHALRVDFDTVRCKWERHGEISNETKILFFMVGWNRRWCEMST